MSRSCTCESPNEANVGLREHRYETKFSLVQPLKRIAFVINASKSGATELAEPLMDAARNCDAEVVATSSYPVPSGFLQGQDVCCTIGGDGTLLSAVDEAVRWNTPIIGVNHGKLGFLATFSPADALDGLRGIMDGGYHIAERALIQCKTEDGQQAVALNDVVVKSTDIRRLISLRVSCDDELVTRYDCDGLIFCTPTGSTAYNLSAGGPILAPGTRVITMTPICPHTLTNRSMVFPAKVQLHVNCMEGQAWPVVTVDGVQRFRGDGHRAFTIETATQPLRLLQPPGHPYFSVLRQKLKWGHL